MEKILRNIFEKLLNGNRFLWYSEKANRSGSYYKTLTGKIVQVTDATPLPRPFCNSWKDSKFVGIGTWQSKVNQSYINDYEID